VIVLISRASISQVNYITRKIVTMRIHCIFSGFSLAVALFCSPYTLAADDDGGDDGYAANDAYGDDGDDEYHGYNAYDDINEDGKTNWDKKALLPRSCINYGGKDVIVFSMFDSSFNQCSGTPDESLYVDVQTFTSAYLSQLELMAEDTGDDWYAPSAAQYVDCLQYDINGVTFYMQLACSSNEDSGNGISVNIYTDNTCSNEYSSKDGDGVEANFDVSDFQIPFMQCRQCVYYVDKEDADDGYYDNRKYNAPLCAGAATGASTCKKSCMKASARAEYNQKDNGWTSADKTLLVILTLFGCGMLAAILAKRRNMSNKETLLEEAALSAAGLKPSHVVIIFVLSVLVIVMFALAELKNLTWGLILILNLALFGYLMKLTVDSGVRDTAAELLDPDNPEIGPNTSGISEASSEASSFA